MLCRRRGGMRKSLAAFMFVVALLLVGAACSAGKTSHAPAQPFVAVSLAAGMSGVGDGPSTPTGDHLRCRSGRHYAQDLTLRNRSGIPVTLTGGVLDWPSALVVQRVAVQVRLAPPPPNGDAVITGLRNWSRSAATPVTIPPGRSAWVQSNFLLRNCGLLMPHGRLITNRAVTLTFTANGGQGNQRLSVPSARIILTR